jgi:hypothetical protein
MSTPFERDPTDAHEQSDADIITMLEAYAREWTDLCHEEALQVVVSVGAVLRIIHGLQKKAASWDKRVAYEDQRDDWFAAFSRLPLEQRRLYKNFLAYKDAMKPKVHAAVPDVIAVVEAGTLKLLICVRKGDVSEDVPYLAFMGQPDGFRASCYTINDLELGDEDMDPLPEEIPKALGLWVLSWGYTMVPGEWSGGDLTAKYADHCTWTRPTVLDLEAFGMLPQLTDWETSEHE